MVSFGNRDDRLNAFGSKLLTQKGQYVISDRDVAHFFSSISRIWFIEHMMNLL